MSEEITQAPAVGDPPALYARWYRIISPSATDEAVAESWAQSIPADREFWTGLAAQPGAGHSPAGLMHLMTIEMGAWCEASGPGNGRASSQWREVTCPACTAKGMTWLRGLVWDMLAAMGPSREALDFALRAGRLGVTDELGRPLAMACAPGNDSARDAIDAQTLHDSPGADLDDGRHPDECPCQFCDEDRREAAAQDDEDDL